MADHDEPGSRPRPEDDGLDATQAMSPLDRPDGGQVPGFPARQPPTSAAPPTAGPPSQHPGPTNRPGFGAAPQPGSGAHAGGGPGPGPTQPPVDSTATARMPAVRREPGADEPRPASAPPARSSSTPWAVLVGLLVGLLLIGGGYLLLRDDDEPSGSGGTSTSAEPSEGSADPSAGSASGEQSAEPSESAADESYSLPTPSGEKSKKPKPGASGCQAKSLPKKSGDQMVQQVTITCAEPTSLTIEPKGKAVIELDGGEHTDDVTVCADSVEFTVAGGSYKWEADGAC